MSNVKKPTPKDRITAHFADAKLVKLIGNVYGVQLMNGTELSRAGNATGAWSQALKYVEANPDRFGVMTHNATAADIENGRAKPVSETDNILADLTEGETAESLVDNYKLEPDLAERTIEARDNINARRKPVLAGKPSRELAKTLLLDYSRVLTPEDLTSRSQVVDNAVEPNEDNINRPRNVPPKVKAHRRHKNKLAAKSKQINRRRNG